MKRRGILVYIKQEILFVTMLFMLLVLTACRQKSAEQNDKEETLDFQFEVEEVYAVSEGGSVVVTGYVQNGIMKVGDKAVLVKEDGTKLETRVDMLEVYDHEKDCTVFTDEVGQDTPVGVLLSGLEKEQVDVGDLLMNSGE